MQIVDELAEVWALRIKAIHVKATTGLMVHGRNVFIKNKRSLRYLALYRKRETQRAGFPYHCFQTQPCVSGAKKREAAAATETSHARGIV